MMAVKNSVSNRLFLNLLSLESEPSIDLFLEDKLLN